MEMVYNGSVNGDPRKTVLENWDSMPNGFYMCRLSQGSGAVANVYKVSNLHGGVFIVGYSSSLPMYGFVTSGTWLWYSIGKTQI